MLQLRDDRGPADGSRTAPGTVPDDLALRRDAVRCRGCGAVVTRWSWACSPFGSHRHRHTNPAGITFDLRCFERAPGMTPRGRGELAHTWFPGMAWRVGHCAGCHGHIGWTFDGAGKRFVALVADRISDPEPG